MAHPLGYAIDYRATVNPMITDPRLVKLLDLETGGATHFDLGMKKTERRELIMKMGEGEIQPDSDKAVKFFHQFEAEYNRVSQASTAFSSSLPENVALSALKNDYLKIRAELNQVNKNLVGLNKQLAARTKSVRKPENVADQLVAIQKKLPDLLKPWLDRIKAEKARIEKEVPNIHSLPTKEELNKEEAEVKSRSRSTLNGKATVEREIKRLEYRLGKARAKSTKGAVEDEKAIADLNAALGKARLESIQRGEDETTATESLTKIKHQKDLLPKKADLSVLESLEEALTKNLDFVFGTSKELAVKDPSVTQLVEKGFFTPDPEKGSKKHGFNLAFMKIMAQHGFDQGINWSPGSVDPMHFELVEGVESILDGKEPGKNEEKKQTNNKGS